MKIENNPIERKLILSFPNKDKSRVKTHMICPKKFDLFILIGKFCPGTFNKIINVD